MADAPHPTGDCPSDASLADMLSSIRKGDREAAAELGMRFAPEIRRRVRGQLGPEMRRLFDSTDIVSTVLRRLDVYVQGNTVRAESEREIRSLLLRICNNAVTDNIRIMRRLKNVEGEDSPFASLLLASLESERPDSNQHTEDRLTEIFEMLDPGPDRQLLWFWLAEQDLATIADNLEISHAAARKRWQRIREHLKQRLGSNDR